MNIFLFSIFYGQVRYEKKTIIKIKGFLKDFLSFSDKVYFSFKTVYYKNSTKYEVFILNTNRCFKLVVNDN